MKWSEMHEPFLLQGWSEAAAQEIDGTPVAVMVLPACRSLLPLIRHLSWKDKKGYYDHLYDLHSLVIRAWGVLGCMECRLHAVVLFYPPYGQVKYLNLYCEFESGGTTNGDA